MSGASYEVMGLAEIQEDQRKIMGELQTLIKEMDAARKEQNERWDKAPVWAFPYQGRKILLRNEVLKPVATELSRIEELLTDIHDKMALHEIQIGKLFEIMRGNRDKLTACMESFRSSDGMGSSMVCLRDIGEIVSCVCIIIATCALVYAMLFPVRG